MASFKEIFGIPASHGLETKFYSHGGGQYEGWTHEERDGQGNLVARYESWAHTDYYGTPTSTGRKKLALDGTVIASGDKLPL